jgi:hypothetical protein
MAERPKPRYPNVTAVIGADPLGRRRQQLASGHSAGIYKMMALEAYALGHPLESVNEFLNQLPQDDVHFPIEMVRAALSQK